MRTVRTEDYAFDLRRNLAPAVHLGVNSGWSVVQPHMPTVCGVADCYSPPIAARGFRLGVTFVVDGRRLVDDGNTGKGDCGLLYASGVWQPDGLRRRGTYHHRWDGRLVSFEAGSRLIPLFGRAGFLLEMTVLNRSGRALSIGIEPNVEPGMPRLLPLAEWDYGVPSPGDAARPADPDTWANDAVALRLYREGERLELGPDREGRLAVAIVFTVAGDPCPGRADFAGWRQETEEAWRRRLSAASGLPELESDIPGLADYYRRSAVSGLVCLWDRPDFVVRPFVATSGMDGGAICTYPWDTGGYAPHGLCLLLGERIVGLLETMGNFGLDRFSRFSPAGTGMSVPYSYNMWSYLSLVWAAACQRGPSLDDFVAAREVFLKIEAGLPRQGELADWGRQPNLLEMRQAGYEHIVASPNAERAWCYDRLADLADALGAPGGADWRARAETIRAAVRRELWDERAGWFRCLYPDGAAELVYSIQIFDALRAGACTRDMAKAVLAHVRDGAFLGEYGVSSVSAEDRLHYELNDPDWSGGGAYTGDGPLLALTLWEQGDAERAWDVLRRLFWMGRHLPYYPQEHYCDRPAVPAHKRANVVAGLAGAEAVLLGLLGLSVGLDGTVRIVPSPRREGEIALRGLSLRGRNIDLSVGIESMRVTVDGRERYVGRPEAVSIAG